MPVYVIHGFRWPRPLIRIHIILNNLDDAAAEWLMAPTTTTTLKDNLHTLHPTIMADIPKLQFIEQYDPADLSSESKSQPYAYVADIVEEIKLGVEIDEVRGQGISNDMWGAMVELRDKLAPGEKIAWFVVVCGDTERSFPPTVQLLEESGAQWRSSNVSGGNEDVVTNGNGNGNVKEKPAKKEKNRSKFAKFFSGRSSAEKELKKQKSNKALNGQFKAQQQLQQQPPPPLPQAKFTSTHHHHQTSSGVTSPPATANLPRESTTSSHTSQRTSAAATPRPLILPSPPLTGPLSPPRPPSTSHQHQSPTRLNGDTVQVMADRPATAGAEPRGQQVFQTVRVPTVEPGEGDKVVRPTVASG